MKPKSINVLLVVVLAVVLGATAQAAAQSSGVEKGPECRFKSFSSMEPPLILGRPFEVPEFRIEFIDARTNSPAMVRTVFIGYFWEWFDYPAVEHPRGAWREGAEYHDCLPQQTVLMVPTRTIEPRGWYAGKYTGLPYTLTGSRRPYFDHIEMRLVTDDCTMPHVMIKKAELERYRNATAIFRVSCDKLVEVTFEPRAPAGTSGK